MSKKIESSKNIEHIDPFAAREAEKYPNPIPSREFILQCLVHKKVPLDLKELCQEFNLHSEEEIEAMRRRLIAMARDGQLEQGHRRKYQPIGAKVLVKGTLHFDRRGVLWCIPELGGPKFQVANFDRDINLHGCKAVVAIPEVKDLAEIKGKLVEVLQTATLRVTGRFVKSNKLSYVIPHGKEIVQDILIPEGKQKHAKDGDIVLVEIVNKQSTWSDLVGDIAEVIGHENMKGVEISAAIHAHSISNKWPTEVEAELAVFAKKNVPMTAKGRVDLRELPLVTIDGEDAKDFDDAVFCEATRSGGWKLYVAIADVSYYVHANTNLDKEAKLRGNSVYFPGKVIPMLPEALSNGLCSLLPEQDRLCMVCELSISKEGDITRHKFYEGIMRSHARLTYTKVAKILAGESKHLIESHAALVEYLKNLQDLYLVLHKHRQLRGALDFDTVETRMIFDDKGKIQRIEPVERNIAHRIIEECMLCANVATAKFLDKHKLPALYRVHEGATEDKLTDLKAYLAELGLTLGKNKKPTPLDYASLLKKVQHRPDAHIIQILLLRSLSQAVYSPDNLGHFGLAYPAYTHFTSPIRRYPDLLVHRQIKLVLHDKWQIAKTKKELEVVAKQKEKFQELAIHCSITERRADDATRDVELWLKCQYIAKHIGQTLPGVISGVNRFGFFVELKDLHVDGLVHVTSLRDDYYVFNHIYHQLVGERTKKQYYLGMPVQVIVAKVNIEERKVDFDLVADQKQTKPVALKRAGKDDHTAAKKKPAKSNNRKASAGRSATTAKSGNYGKTLESKKKPANSTSNSRSRNRSRKKPNGKPIQK